MDKGDQRSQEGTLIIARKGCAGFQFQQHLQCVATELYIWGPGHGGPGFGMNLTVLLGNGDCTEKKSSRSVSNQDAESHVLDGNLVMSTLLRLLRSLVAQ